jgi:hypothetical protein
MQQRIGRDAISRGRGTDCRDDCGLINWRPARFRGEIVLLKRAIGVVHQRRSWQASVSS